MCLLMPLKVPWHTVLLIGPSLSVLLPPIICATLLFWSCSNSPSLKSHPAEQVMSKKKSLYIGGLAEDVSKDVITAMCVPFGIVRDVDVPMDFKTGKIKGFAFVTFESSEDAHEALYNLEESELYGRTLNVRWSSQDKDFNDKTEAIWKGEKWLKEHGTAEEGDNGIVGPKF